MNIMDGTLDSLSNITARLKELSSQAANGTYSTSQRASMSSEADALVREYNRLISATSFNGRSLFGTSDMQLALQAGFGNDNVLSTSLARGLNRSVGDRTYGAAISSSVGNDTRQSVTGDFNNDGKEDIILSSLGSDRINVMLGDGAGGFSTTDYFADNPATLVAGDFNGDGFLDIAAHSTSVAQVSILLNNGSGGFGAPTTVATTAAGGSFFESMVGGDFDGDGRIDLAVPGSGNQNIQILRGNGSGGFAAYATFATSGSVGTLTVGDFNGDGRLDIAGGDLVLDSAEVFLNGGGGAFTRSANILPGLGNVQGLAAGDINGDGKVDLVVAGQSGTSTTGIYLGRGDGTFTAGQTYAETGTYHGLKLVDLDGDGILDLLSATSNTLSIRSGAGDGTFGSSTSLSAGASIWNGVFGDFNGDGVLDIGATNSSSNPGSFKLFLANSSLTNTIATLDLSSRSAALSSLSTLDLIQNKIALERSNVGAFMSRLDTGVRNLYANQVEEKAASARITDADIGEESANAIRLSILQNVGVAVLAQANNQAGFLLDLIRK